MLCERRYVDVGGRTYECGPATLAAVALACDLLPAQVETCLARRDTIAWNLVDDILRTCPPAALARVLATCIVGRPPSAPDDLVACARAVLELTDLSAVVSGLSAMTERVAEEVADLEAAAPDEPTMAQIAVVTVAARFGCAPHEVYAWPYSSFLAATRCLPMLRLHDGPEPRQRPTPRGPAVRWDDAFATTGIKAKPVVH